MKQQPVQEMETPQPPPVKVPAPKQEVILNQSQQKDDIMKELEDYVKEKNHKYLDDLSDIDAENATPG